jgi:hypothetical protein
MRKVSAYFDKRKKVEEDKNSNQVSNGIGNLESR